MQIDFSKIAEERVEGLKGGEGTLLKRAFSDRMGTVMLDRLAPGASIGMHCHTDDCEVMFILSGTASFQCDGVEETVQAGSCHYCPKGSTHCLKNKGTDELVFFAVLPKQ